MVDRLWKYPERTKIQVLAPIVSGRKGTHVKLFEDIKKQGFVRVRVNGEMMILDDEIELDKNKKHSIEVVIDRIVVKEDVAARLADSLETALRLGEGRVLLMLWTRKNYCLVNIMLVQYAVFQLVNLNQECFHSIVRLVLVRNVMARNEA